MKEYIGCVWFILILHVQSIVYSIIEFVLRTKVPYNIFKKKIRDHDRKTVHYRRLKCTKRNEKKNPAHRKQTYTLMQQMCIVHIATSVSNKNNNAK